MNKNELITLAANSKELKGFCKKLCNGNDIYLDVFQEFLLYLLEQDEKKLIKKYEDIHFIGYCYYVLRLINERRIRFSNCINSKNVLSKIGKDIPKSSDLIISNSYDQEVYNEDIEEKFNKTIEFLETDKSVKKYQVAILFASLNKSTREISEMIGTKERVVIYQNNKLKEKIKANVK